MLNKNIFVLLFMIIGIIASTTSAFALNEIAFEDTFNRADNSTVGNGWVEYEPSSTSVSISNNSAYFVDNSISDSSKMNRTLTENVTEAVARIKVSSGSSTFGHILIDSAGSGTMTTYFWNTGTFYYHNGASFTNSGVSYSIDTYYDINFTDIDYENETYDIYIDDSLIVNDASFKANNETSTALFSGTGGTTQTANVDNVAYYREAVGSELLTDLVAYYPLDNKNDSHADFDFTGVATSINTSGCILGTCYDFESSSSNYFESDDDDAFTFNDAGDDEPFSISVWLNPESFTGQFAYSKFDLSGSGREWGLSTSATGTIGIAIYSPTGTAYRGVSTVATIPLSNFSHVVATYDGTESVDGFKVYIDGVLQTSYTNATSGTYTGMSNTGSKPILGARWNSYPTINIPYDGKVDELGLWNKELDQDDIDELYNSGSGLTYPFSIQSVNDPVITDIKITPNGSVSQGTDVSFNCTVRDDNIDSTLQIDWEVFNNLTNVTEASGIANVTSQVNTEVYSSSSLPDATYGFKCRGQDIPTVGSYVISPDTVTITTPIGNGTNFTCDTQNETVFFGDSFTRPSSDNVGNGWIETEPVSTVIRAGGTFVTMYTNSSSLQRNFSNFTNDLSSLRWRTYRTGGSQQINDELIHDGTTMIKVIMNSSGYYVSDGAGLYTLPLSFTGYQWDYFNITNIDFEDDSYEISVKDHNTNYTDSIRLDLANVITFNKSAQTSFKQYNVVNTVPQTEFGFDEFYLYEGEVSCTGGNESNETNVSGRSSVNVSDGDMLIDLFDTDDGVVLGSPNFNDSYTWNEYGENPDKEIQISSQELDFSYTPTGSGVLSSIVDLNHTESYYKVRLSADLGTASDIHMVLITTNDSNTLGSGSGEYVGYHINSAFGGLPIYETGNSTTTNQPHVDPFSASNISGFDYIQYEYDSVGSAGRLRAWTDDYEGSSLVYDSGIINLNGNDPQNPLPYFRVDVSGTGGTNAYLEEIYVLKGSPLVVDASPNINSVNITPLFIQAGDLMTGDCNYTDDGSPVVTLQWFEDDTLVHTGIDLTADVEGTEYILQCAVNDTVNPVVYQNSSPLYVANSEISLDNILILPVGALDNQTIYGYVEGSDPDDENSTVDWKWYRNGALFDSGSVSKYFDDDGEEYNISSVDPINTTADDVFIFEITLTDDNSTTGAFNSSGLTIGESNVLPVAEESFIVPSPIANSFDEMIGWCNVSDANGDSLTIHYQVYEDDVMIFNDSYTMQDESARVQVFNFYGTREKQYILECFGEDVFGQSNRLNSSITEYQNFAPEIDEIIFSPSSIDGDENVNITMDSLDGDGDNVSVNITFNVNGIPMLIVELEDVPTGSYQVLHEFDESFYTWGDNITADILIHDGFDNDTKSSDTLVVNSEPIAPAPITGFGIAPILSESGHAIGEFAFGVTSEGFVKMLFALAFLGVFITLVVVVIKKIETTIPK